MRTVILRLVEDGVTDGDLHGVLERPGQAAVPFGSTAALLVLLREVVEVAEPPDRPTGPAAPSPAD